MTKKELITEKWRPIHELFCSCKQFVISTHVNPDGDAVGASIALQSVLEKLKKDSRLICPSPIPVEYTFLDPRGIFSVYSSEDRDFIASAEAILILDIGDPVRLKEIWEIVQSRKITTVCIDHHPKNHDHFDFEIIDTSVPATGYLIWEYLQAYHPELIDLNIAEALYTALMTDTGSFRFENSTVEAHQMAVNLLEKGVQPDKIYKSVYENDPETRLRLLGLVLREFNLEAQGKIAWFRITEKELASTGATKDDVEGFTDFLRRLKGLEISIMFMEAGDKKTRVNFRSKGKYPVNKLASLFGGGGHPCAAGCVVSLPMDKATEMVLQAAHDMIKKEE